MSNSSFIPSPLPSTFAPSLAPISAEVDQGDLLSGILNLVLLVLVVFTCIGICCSSNRGYLRAKEFINDELDPVDLRRNMAHSPFGVIRLEQGKLSESSFWCCFSKDSVVPRQDTALVLFFPTRLKYEWKPTLAILQFVLGWIAIITTIIGMISPSNSTNKTLGTAALFLGEIILHVWYGFLRYPNLMSCILQGEDNNDGLFDAMRHIFGLAYHNGQTTQFPQWIDYICFLLILPFHIGALFGCVASFILFSVIDHDQRRRSDAGENTYVAALLGALFGSVIYPLNFLQATTSGEILAISVAHHIVQEYYEAKLFNKGAKSFFAAIFCKFFSEIIGVDETVDVDVEMDQTVVNNYNNREQNVENEQEEERQPKDDPQDSQSETSSGSNHESTLATESVESPTRNDENEETFAK